VFEARDEGICMARSAYPVPGLCEGTARSDLGIIPTVKAIVVGLDIREYSRRSPEQQLFLTLNLHASIHKAIRLLQRAGICSLFGEPRIIVQTGDGAHVVFTFIDAFNPFEAARRWKVNCGALKQLEEKRKKLEEEPRDGVKPKDRQHALEKNREESQIEKKKIDQYAREKEQQEANYFPHAIWQAMSFVFTLNGIMNGDNTRQSFYFEDPKSKIIPAFPLECRFAMSYEDVLLLSDISGNLNCVGKGMVTCARILSTDHGNHFLIQEQLLNALARHGGLLAVGGGLWENRLHYTMLEEARIKHAGFRYANVFGFYRDGPLLPAIGRLHDPPKTYQIGSHDLRTIDIHP
jgi:hypothetical protein